MIARDVEVYETDEGRRPFLEWLDSLRDARTRAKVRVGIDRMSLGNFGRCKTVGSGVSEMKIDFGPGYRLYFGQIPDRLILLLCGGDKGSQQKDIKRAKGYWKEYRSRHGEK